ncbi:uncharacterized protein LOC113522845 [Galleria mellonella]|uniref:Uncharacterized protein LOC113522845 n=1 Tax=Galleria mellonella TaxID=7137 RepID=A0A6J1X964_GALME|nr:uncharacterized protein LOC113522845 [Galleria mellonella]
MVINKNIKQQKITKIFRKGLTVPKQSDHRDEEHEEILKLQQVLKGKQDELFQLQRNSFRCKASPPTKRKPDPFVRPQKIVLANSVASLKRDLELMAMLSSMEVQSYVANDHCSIIYHMQHDSKNEIKHGLRIEMKPGAKEVSKFSLPLGFNFDGVMEDFNNIMMPDCLGAIRKALVAYYDRLEQYDALKRLLNVEAELFKKIDGSHIEITFVVKSNDPEEEQIGVVLMLDYRIYDIRPKTFNIREIDLPDGAAEALQQQCIVFRRKPLRKAFKEAFIDGVGPYKFVRQVGEDRPDRPQHAHKRRRVQTHAHYNNDDTFRPEECSDRSDDEDN